MNRAKDLDPGALPERNLARRHPQVGGAKGMSGLADLRHHQIPPCWWLMSCNQENSLKVLRMTSRGHVLVQILIKTEASLIFLNS
jgi:hypothetical protein